MSRLNFIISHHDYIVAKHLSTFIESQGFSVVSDNISLSNLTSFVSQREKSVIVMSRRNYKNLFESLELTLSSDLVLVNSSNFLKEQNHSLVIEVPFLNYEILNAISS